MPPRVQCNPSGTMPSQGRRVTLNMSHGTQGSIYYLPSHHLPPPVLRGWGVEINTAYIALKVAFIYLCIFKIIDPKLVAYMIFILIRL